MQAKRSGLYIAPLLLVIGAGLMIAGIVRGEHMTVLRKAVMICLECIGIG